jgi:hypothetical protein
MVKGDGYGHSPGQLGAMKPGSIDCVLSSPPYGEARKPNTSPGDVLNTDRKDLQKWAWNETTQGKTAGNLGAMKPGSVDAILSSPPYAETLKPETEDQTARKQERIAKSKTLHDGRRHESPSPGKAALGGGYGQTPGNLGNLKPGDVSAIISSPPYEGQVAAQDIEFYQKKCRQTGRNPESPHAQGISSYGASQGQLGNTQGPTFWEAARDIVAQCLQILRPGGYAIWVVKDFVRAKKRVDFTGDWRKLCEAAGFQTLHEHHAMLYKEDRFVAFWGEEIIDRTNRNSFFRTLTNNKAGWAAYWEIVPEDERQEWLATAKEQLPPGKRQHIILGKAQELAFKDTLERIESWNEHVRIDFETVLCMRKPE